MTRDEWFEHNKEARHKPHAGIGVVCLETETTYKSIKEASNVTGIDRSVIYRACSGLALRGGGYHWKFADDTRDIIKLQLSPEDLPNEEWKDVKNYEGLYMISNLGRLKSLHANTQDKILEASVPYVTKRTGNRKKVRYLTTNLFKNGQYRCFTIHKLVAEAFIPNPDNLPLITHWDEDKHNNCVDNLDWVDYNKKRFSNTYRQAYYNWIEK